jgi:hypothetical protein
MKKMLAKISPTLKGVAVVVSVLIFSSLVLGEKK